VIHFETADADSPDMPRRFASFALSATVATVSGFAALSGLFWGFGLKCDDSCGDPPPWRDDVNAWQWEALGVVGVVAFGCSLVFVVALAAGRRTLASLALTAWVLAAVAYLVLFRDSGLTSHAGRGWLGLAIVAGAGVVAIASRPPRARHPLSS
jgi:hypothetical protein